MHAAGRVADRYDVIRPLGHGAFGHTYLARSRESDRLVALKVLQPRHWKAYELFEREAAVLRQLRHPGVPAIYEAFEGEWEGAKAALLAMEYVAGPSLAEVIAEQRHFPTEEIVQLFVELLGVLDYLHSRVPPVLHRDIKPANLILRPGGAATLVDFGSVRNVFRGPDESGSTVAGTYGYMPFEQTMGQASPSSDLYALAATFLHLVTGRPPSDFIGDESRIEVPRALPCGEPLRGALARMLAPAMSSRYASAREVRAALFRPAAAPAAMTADAALAVLSPTPRELTGETAALMKRTAYTVWALMNSDGEPGTRPSAFDMVLIGFFSLATFGMLPAALLSRASARRRRVKTFMRDGLLANAEVLDLSEEKVEFGARLIKTRYTFDADGQQHIGSDRVLPARADRWGAGSTITILYLRDRDYDSIIL